MEELNYKPIGTFKCQQKYPYDSPVQGVFAKDSFGCIELNNEIPQESLKDLNGFERIWLIYDFF